MQFLQMLMEFEYNSPLYMSTHFPRLFSASKFAQGFHIFKPYALYSPYVSADRLKESKSMCQCCIKTPMSTCQENMVEVRENKIKIMLSFYLNKLMLVFQNLVDLLFARVYFRDHVR